MPQQDKGRKAIEKKNKVLEKLAIEYVPMESIQPNSYNPNRQSEHDFELLLKSMREDGFTQPIVCQAKTREIVDGEHRWRAAQRLGFTEVPVVFVDMTPEQMRIATLRHNRARGSEDIDLTAQVLRDLQSLGALDWAQDSLMLDDVELNRLIEDFPAPEALAASEFSSAWEPADRLEGQTEATQVREGNLPGHTIVQGMTPAALEARREEEKRLQQARTEEERQMVKKESTLYRLHLVFAGEEAEVVSKVLGETPAETLLALCKRQQEAA
ncbi:MAG TPA: ParB/RepB/Spo0J family partition protein [Chthonomonadaceae bacterium]|nr:ParB/RepB/Spo0J family partition protein [Chthonomonadaceae bacterium]